MREGAEEGGVGRIRNGEKGSVGLPSQGHEGHGHSC